MVIGCSPLSSIIDPPGAWDPHRQLSRLILDAATMALLDLAKAARRERKHAWGATAPWIMMVMFKGFSSF